MMGDCKKLLIQMKANLSEIKDTECGLLGNLYKMQNTCPKSVKTDIERLSRKIKSKSLSAEMKCKVLEGHLERMQNELNEKDELIKNLQNEIAKKNKECMTLKSEVEKNKVENSKQVKENKILKDNVSTMKKDLESSQLVISGMIGNSFGDDEIDASPDLFGISVSQKRKSDVLDDENNN